MNEKTKSSVVFFDIESTGLNQQTDRIIELYMRKINPDGTQEEFYSKFNPYPVEVSEEAAKVHGLTSNDLLGEPLFSERVDEIISFIEGSALGGYNIIHFDIPMLFEELYRAGKIYDFKKHQIIDVYKIWTLSEPRTLSGAVSRFLNKSHDNAHKAKDDVLATAEIFEKQLEIYSHLYESIESMIDLTNEDLKKNLDFSGKFQRSDDEIIVSFGKHKGKSIQTVLKEDAEYFRWIFEKSEMPTDTRLIARKIYATSQVNG
jgi:DNA polymerase-3 subunit epsilon